jgi:hypothetical protein
MNFDFAKLKKDTGKKEILTRSWLQKWLSWPVYSTLIKHSLWRIRVLWWRCSKCKGVKTAGSRSGGVDQVLLRSVSSWRSWFERHQLSVLEGIALEAQHRGPSGELKSVSLRCRIFLQRSLDCHLFMLYLTPLHMGSRPKASSCWLWVWLMLDYFRISFLRETWTSPSVTCQPALSAWIDRIISNGWAWTVLNLTDLLCR